MFTVAERASVLAQLVDRARSDAAIVGAAVTGSAADGTADRFSDIDLVLGVDAALDVAAVVRDWSEFAYRDLGALHHFDLGAGSAVYRALLLPDSLEIDLGFTPEATFHPLGAGGFQVLFGDAGPREVGAADPDHIVGLCWHHVLHAHTSLERGRWWEAEHWISAVRDLVLSLACIRLDLPAAHAKGAHRLSPQVTEPLEDTLVATTSPDELARALRAVVRVLRDELALTSPGLAATLRTTLNELAGTRLGDR